jgi:hypothetical protein
MTDWLYPALWAALALQSIGWLVTLIRMFRLADEVSSASAVIINLRDLCLRQKDELGGEDTKNVNIE